MTHSETEVGKMVATWEDRHKGGDDYWALHRAATDTNFDMGEYRSDILALLRERDRLKAKRATKEQG